MSSPGTSKKFCDERTNELTNGWMDGRKRRVGRNSDLDCVFKNGWNPFQDCKTSNKSKFQLIGIHVLVLVLYAMPIQCSE